VKQKKNLIFLASIVQSEILFNDASKNVPFSREIAKNQFFHKILQREPILKKFQVVRNEYIIGTINAKLNTGKILSDCMMKNLPNKGFNSKTDFKFVRATLDMTLKEIFLYSWTKYLKKELTISDMKKQANNLEVLANILESDNDTLKDFMSSTLEEVTKEYLNSKSFSKDKETLVKEQMENCVSWKGKCSGHCYNFKKAYEIFIIGESKQNSGYLEYFKGEAQEEFAKELLATFHEELSVIHFVNSGSEANELALRMAKAMTGEKDTEHSTNPIPLWFVTSTNHREKKSEDMLRDQNEVHGLLSDVAPTVLDILGIEKPQAMNGTSLLSILQ
jgi:hypothetical protein